MLGKERYRYYFLYKYMSVIVRCNINNMDNDNSNGYPCGSVSVLDVYYDETSIQIKFEDPKDTTVDSIIILSTWKNTILVRKSGSYPQNESDGTVLLNNTTRDAYKDIYFVDSGLSANTTYYYRFFTVSNAGVINNAEDMMFTAKTSKTPDPVLNNNDWDTINKVIQDGRAQEFWNIGDEININLNISSVSGKRSIVSGNPYVMQIWGFDLFGTPSVLFGSKYVQITSIASIKLTSTNDFQNVEWGDYNNYLSEVLMNDIYNSIQDQTLKSIIKSVDIPYSYVSRYATEKIFIPTGEHAFNGGPYSTKFPIFTDDNSRIRTSKNGSKSYDWYLLNTYNVSGPYHIMKDIVDYVKYDGSRHDDDEAYEKFIRGQSQSEQQIGVVFCFVV